MIPLLLLQFTKKERRISMEKIAVITGCNRGVGEGVRDELIKEGYFVYGINRTPSQSKISDSSYKELICDISDTSTLKKICKDFPK